MLLVVWMVGNGGQISLGAHFLALAAFAPGAGTTGHPGGTTAARASQHCAARYRRWAYIYQGRYYRWIER